jgi:hypothetical protein
MTNLTSRFEATSTPTQGNNLTSDAFANFGTQDLSALINAAAQALYARGLPRAVTVPAPPDRSTTLTKVTENQAPKEPQRQRPSRFSPPLRQTTTAIQPPLPLRPPALLPASMSRPPDMWDNAKVEQILCAGLKPPYDGSVDNLIPTLNLIYIRRRNEVWYSATLLGQPPAQIDLVTQFSKASPEAVLNNVKHLWDASDAAIQCHTRGTPTYNSRLLGVFLMNSLTPEFAALLHSRIDSDYCSDGPLLLHTMCQHIHRNHRAFVESIKNKIRISTLQEFQNDVAAYLRLLKSNLKLISSTGDNDDEHNDLLPHLLLQLRGTTIPLFQQAVLKWQRDFFESTLKLTPQQLVTKADQEQQILLHAGQWVETIDPSVSAMRASLQATKQQSGDLLQALFANFSQRSRESSRSTRYSTRPPHKSSMQQHPDWLFEPPQYPDQIKFFNGRYWHFCPHCGQQGRWVCTHTASTHNDAGSSSFSTRMHRRSPTYDSSDVLHQRSRSPVRDHGHSSRSTLRHHHGRSRSRSPGKFDHSSPYNSPKRHVTWEHPAPSTPVAKLSLLDSVNMFLDDVNQESP